MLKRHSMHCKADEKNGTACEFEDIDASLREVLDRPIKDLEQRIRSQLDADEGPQSPPSPASSS